VRPVSRARLTTLLVSVCTLAAIVGVSFGVQAAGLGRPSSNPQLVARVLAKLLPYTVARTTMTVDGKRLTAVCVADWIDHHRVTTVVLDDGTTLREVGTHLLAQGGLALGEFELAGCPRPLRKWLTSELNDGGPIKIGPTRIADEHVLGIRFSQAKLKLEVYVSRNSLFPVALSLHDHTVSGTSSLSYGARAAGGAAGGAS
jgi:hypothetical protein